MDKSDKLREFKEQLCLLYTSRITAAGIFAMLCQRAKENGSFFMNFGKKEWTLP